MSEQQTAGGTPEPAVPTSTQSAAPVQPQRALLDFTDRKTRVITGSFLAGVGLSLAAGFVMRVVQLVSPNGAGISIAGDVMFVVFLAGPVFGFGLAMALTALLPPTRTPMDVDPIAADSAKNPRTPSGT